MSRTPYDPFAADCWAMGVTLIYMVTKKYAFRYDDNKTLLADQKNAAYKRRYTNQVSNELKDLINQLLEPEETKRITMSGALTHAWIVKQGRCEIPEKTKKR